MTSDFDKLCKINGTIAENYLRCDGSVLKARLRGLRAKGLKQKLTGLTEPAPRTPGSGPYCALTGPNGLYKRRTLPEKKPVFPFPVFIF